MAGRALRLWLLCAVVAAAAACPLAFGFDREPQVSQGEIIGRAIAIGSGEATPLVSVSLLGQPPLRAGPLGGFRLSGVSPGLWTVDIQGDDDGDGIVDRRDQKVVRLRAPSGPEEGAFMGEVVLQAPASVSGTATVADGTELPITVVAVRELSDQESGLSWQSTNEARAEVRPDGTWRLDGLASGRVSVFAFQPVLLGNVHATDPVILDVAPGEIVEGVDLVLEERRLTSVPTFIELRPSPDGPVTVVAMRAGTHPDAELRIELDQGLDVLINQNFNAPPSGIVQVQVPVGERLDVYFHTGDRSGVLYDQSVTASGDAVRIGPVQMRPMTACNPNTLAFLDRTARRDCDGDGLPGLPPALDPDDGQLFVEPLLAIWQGCAAAGTCTGTGDRASHATCLVEGVVYDCDDDGDGLPDLNETPDCYHLGAGADRDADGICDTRDPFPFCPGIIWDEGCEDLVLETPIVLPDYAPPAAGDGEPDAG